VKMPHPAFPVARSALPEILSRGFKVMAENEGERHAIPWAQFISETASALLRQHSPQSNPNAVLAGATAAPAPDSPESNLASSPTNNKDRPSQSKTAAELAKMIEADLGCHPDCPKAGFRITVYGWPNWRAMLTIGPAAGPVRDPQRWRDLTDELAERLRNRYDLAWGE
jgi:hypothetical protein